MENILKKFFRSSIVISITMIALGFMLIFYSAETIKFISYVVGAIVIAIGTTAIIRFIQSLKQPFQNELDVAYGIISIVLGILIITHPTAIASFVPAVLGMGIIINSAIKLQYSLELRASKNELWKSTIIISFISLICGLVLIFNPFKAAEAFTMIVGILIIIYAVLDIISTFVIRRNVTTLQKTIQMGISEKKKGKASIKMDADVVEEEEVKEEEESN